MLRVVEAVPELASDPKLFAVNARLLDTSSDGILVLVSPSAIDMAVASLDSVSDSCRSLLLGDLPGAETDLGDLGTVGQGEVGGPSDGRNVHLDDICDYCWRCVEMMMTTTLVKARVWQETEDAITGLLGLEC